LLFDIVKQEMNVRLVRRSRRTPLARAALLATTERRAPFDKQSIGNQKRQCFQWAKWPSAEEIKGALCGHCPAGRVIMQPRL